ncbi:MAG: excinuclease ABC subunit UvrC [Firmicutes bacterium]|nr:excinuclease ABC subunit UvrC [Bacillota bacterium]
MPGVYTFKDQDGKVLYVGKAKNLRNRVRSYFSPGNREQKAWTLRKYAADIDYVVTVTEVEALLLESHLIKKYRPRYNVRLKDDKDYPYIKLDLEEDYPRLEIVRKMKRDKARYFGPYPNAGVVNETVRLANKLFPLRTCGDWRNKPRPCLNFHIKRCLAPCQAKVSPEEYRQLLDQVIMFLEGKHQELLASLKARMEAAARELEFEMAAEIRDQIEALEKLAASQRIVSRQQWNLDVLAVGSDGGATAVNLLAVRGGKVLGNQFFVLEHAEPTQTDEAAAAFIRDYYGEITVIPREILVSDLPQGEDVLAAWLTEKAGRPVKLRVPQKGTKKRLLEMAAENLREQLHSRQRNEAESQSQGESIILQLKQVLGLEQPPRRVECYDISHIQGSDTVASMVVFEAGVPARSQYRRFKIRDLTGPDDFASMAQVLRRRFEAATEGKEGFRLLPDLVVVDGGKGQLSAAHKEMKNAGYADINIVSLAKREEEVFVPGQSAPLVIDKAEPALKLLQQLRDEAHRFAITYHRKLRTKNTLSSELDKIPGVGPARRTALLKAFGSLEKLREKDVAEIAAVPGIPWPVAEAIYRYFRKNK